MPRATDCMSWVGSKPEGPHPGIGETEGQHDEKCAERERDVGCCGYGPASEALRIAKVERDIEERGDEHPSCGRNAREKAPGPGGEFAVDKLALDLKRPTSWKETAIRPSFIQ